MTQSTLPLQKTSREEAVARLLVANANRWIDGRLIATAGGAYAWRTRLSDVRRKRHWQIENRIRREAGYAVSEYRLVLSDAGA